MSRAGATSPSELQIWLADLEALASALEAAEARHGLLALSERDWLAQSPPQSRRWRRLARIGLRIALARAGAADARAGEFQADANGKPSLPGTALAFNASHAGGVALFVISAHGPVGIDLESERTVALGERRRAMIEIAASALLRGRHPTAFLQAWTCLEAFAKARGTGIGALLTELGITAAGTKQLTDAEIRARAAATLASSPLEIRPLEVPATFYACVAAPRPIPRAGLIVHTLAASDFDLAAAGFSAV